MLRIMPVEGRRVRDPRTKQVLPADGLVVHELDLYFARRVRDGDVTVQEMAHESTPEPTDKG